MKMNEKSKFIFKELKSITLIEIIIINLLFIIMKISDFINISKKCKS